MKKILFLVFVLAVLPAIGQDMNQNQNQVRNQTAREKLEAARIALITERLGLTPDQAQTFWPIYNEYAEQRRRIQQEYKQSRQGMKIDNLTEEQQKQLLRGRMEEKQRQLNLESKYGDRLMEVINARQMMALKKAEDDFRAMIIRRIEQRQRQQLQQQMLRQQRERKLKQGNN